MASKTKNTRERKDRIKLAAIILALITIASLSYFYINKTSCSAEIEKCCLSSTRAYIVIKGDCKDALLRITDPITGQPIYTGKIFPGKNVLNVTVPGFQTYRVEIIKNGKIIASKDVNTTVQPYVEKGAATLFPNGTLTIMLKIRGDTKCFDDYAITQVRLGIVYNNGTKQIVTYNGTWDPTKRINIETGLDPAQLYALYLNITDTLNTYTSIGVILPK